jgi:hypothetical protein
LSAFVLVIGVWHDGWRWTRVAPLLRAGGHGAYAPPPTGLGEREHLLSPYVDLDTYVADVTGAME